MTHGNASGLWGGTAPAATAVRGRWRQLLARLEQWGERAAQRRALGRLDAAALADIGVDPGAAQREARKPFWRD